jgi:hypothetical protein
MPGIEWFQLMTAALGGGLTVKALDILYQEVRHALDRSHSAKKFVDIHLDPLLKAADELVGKLRSLAEDDFRSLRNIAHEPTQLNNHDFASLLFILASFWAQVEVMRRESPSVSIVRDKRGKRLQSFLDCMESRRVRLVDRISQRAVGELMLSRQNGTFQTTTFIDFVRIIETTPEAPRWVASTSRILCRAHHTSERQKLLQYGVVIHALIDTLDPHHEVTRERPSFPNKLSRKTWRDLRYRVFGRYLTFVRNKQKYLGPPKKGGPKKR